MSCETKHNKTEKKWKGKVNLIYGNICGKTEIKSVFSQAPFKIQRPFYPEGQSICHTVIMHTAGGLVGGDILNQNIDLLSNAQVFITTPSAAKIYRSGQKQVIQNIEINLASNSYLEYLPQESIVFNQAQFRQNMTIKLADNASFLTWEITRFGRSARGEIFSEGTWVNNLEIWQGQKLIFIDRKKLQGEENHFYSVNGLNGKPVVGNLIFIPPKQEPNLNVSVRELINQKFPAQSIDTTTLQTGLSCRYHGESTSACKDMFISIWQYLRQTQKLNHNFKSRIWY